MSYSNYFNYQKYRNNTPMTPYAPYSNTFASSGGNNIAINELEFWSTMRYMQGVIDAVNVEYDIWAGKGELSSTFDTFVIQYKQLQLIMENYQKLMQKNKDAINKILEQLVQMDESLANTLQ